MDDDLKRLAALAEKSPGLAAVLTMFGIALWMLAEHWGEITSP
jgi:hypothetical protein